MSMKKSVLLCLLSSLPFLNGCVAPSPLPRSAKPAAVLEIYTETYPPLNFIENGRITGQATDVVRELMKRTGTRADIRLATWEEGYKAVQEKPDVVLFSVAMTPERKPLFQWVGPIAVLEANLYAKKGSKIVIGSLAEAKNLPKVVAVKDYYTEQLLKKEGFGNLESVATEEIGVRKLLDGEAQLFPAGNITLPALLNKAGATMADVESVFGLSSNLIYIAFSRDTSKELVARWQAGLDEMKSDGSFRRIYTKWLPGEEPPGITPQ